MSDERDAKLEQNEEELIKALLNHLDKLEKHQKELLKDFDYRVSFLREHRKQVRTIVEKSKIIRTSKSVSEKKIALVAIVPMIEKIIVELENKFVNILIKNRPIETKNQEFHTRNNGVLVSDIILKEEKILWDDENILKKALKINFSKDHNEGKLLIGDAKRKIETFVKEYEIDFSDANWLHKINEHFIELGHQYEKIITKQNKFIHYEIEMLLDLKKAVVENNMAGVLRISSQLIKAPNELDAYVKDEKDHVIGPIENLFRKKHDITKKIQGKKKFIFFDSKTVTLENIKNDLKRFSHSYEYVSYIDKIRELMIKHPKWFKDLNRINRFLSIYRVLLSSNLQKYERERKNLTHIAMRNPLSSLLNKRSFDTDMIIHMYETIELTQIASGIPIKDVVDTGAYKIFEYKMQEALKTSRRNEAIGFSLMVFDIDDFKIFNEIYGHSIGDDVIRFVAKVMRDMMIRKTDGLYHQGGEEFAIILPLTNKDSAFESAEMVRKAIESQSVKFMKSVNYRYREKYIKTNNIDSRMKEQIMEGKHDQGLLPKNAVDAISAKYPNNLSKMKLCDKITISIGLGNSYDDYYKHVQNIRSSNVRQDVVEFFKKIDAVSQVAKTRGKNCTIAL